VSEGLMRALVVDDESLARRGICARLARVGGVLVVGECDTGRAAVEAIRRLRPDLVFLDVQMPGLDGFGVVEQIGVDRMPILIFVTAYDEHAMRAFDVHAIDYVLKPIDDDRFARAVARARDDLAGRNTATLATRLSALLAERERLPHRDARLAVRDRGRIVLVDPNDVSWIAADGDYVRIHVGTTNYLIRETMTAIEARLAPISFVRIHRSTIVNVHRIQELAPQLNGEYIVVLRDGVRLKSSRSYADRLRQIVGTPL
jgi:two-component system LytT family response regulator